MSLGDCSMKGGCPGWPRFVQQAGRRARANVLKNRHLVEIAAVGVAAVGVPARGVAGGQRSKVASDAAVKVCDLVAGGE